MTKTELENWADVHDKAVAINDFLEWLEGRTIPIVLAQRYKDYDCLLMVSTMRQQLIEEHFNINAYKLEMERLALLKEASQ